MHLSDQSTSHGQKPEADTLPGCSSGWQALECALTQTLEGVMQAPQDASVALLRIALLHGSSTEIETDWLAASSLTRQILERLHKALPQTLHSFCISPTQLALVLQADPNGETLAELVANAEEALSRTVEIEESPILAEAVTGAAVFPQDGTTAGALITAANAALFEAHSKGVSYQEASADSTESYSDHIAQDHALRRAITRADLHLEFLPVMESTSERIIGFEARPLWIRPEHRHEHRTTPVNLRQATRLGLIETLNIWTLKNACLQALTWSQPLGVSVGISPLWLSHERLSETLRKLLAETGFPAQRLQLELSERSFFSAPEIARKELARIRAMGVRLALDNFGMGYSSLERLKHYPFDQIKLDSTFTHNILEDWRAQALLRAILHLVSSLDMRCCATGVETQEQFAFLAVNGCQEIQGKVAGPSIETC